MPGNNIIARRVQTRAMLSAKTQRERRREFENRTRMCPELESPRQWQGAVNLFSRNAAGRQRMAGHLAGLYKRLHAIRNLIDAVEQRAMAVDGPVNNTRDEMTDAELRRIYQLAGGEVRR